MITVPFGTTLPVSGLTGFSVEDRLFLPTPPTTPSEMPVFPEMRSGLGYLGQNDV